MTPFIKMHGLGNDFVVFDARRAPLAITPERTRRIADRHRGVGCDQVIVIEPPADGGADARLRILNADGSEAEACGNATRCIAAMVMKEKNADRAAFETKAGRLSAEAAPAGEVAVDMGPASLDWRKIPLAHEADTLHLGIGEGPLQDPVAVNVGNPHAVFFVDDAEAAPLATAGPALEHHPLFPERTNVEAAEVRTPGEIRLRVWERGAGLTQACGSGACAALVAAHARGLTGRAADVVVDGGRLRIEWLDNGHVRMTGPVAVSFTGTLDETLLD